ncbi:MAG: MATE family efflux transporter [Pseudomonadota bacterium]|nr:MATE family efflux transporter [Pseudomonadota bacterium]
MKNRSTNGSAGPVGGYSRARSQCAGVVRESGQIAVLAGPLIVSQVSQVAMGFTDTVMAGRIGATDLAAIALGSSLWFPVYLACVGLLMALSPTVAQIVGAGRVSRTGSVFRQGLWLAFFAGFLAFPVVRRLDALMGWIDIDTPIASLAGGYLDAVSWGMPAICVYLVFRFVSEGIGQTRPVMYIQIVALGLNALGNYILMFGKFGAPALGAVGAGWATAIVMWLDALMIAAWVWFHPRYVPLRLFQRLPLPDRCELGRLVRLGTPMAAGIVIEVGLFSAISLLMGSLGAEAVAAHQIALNYSALMFMIPLGLSMAVTIRVGHAVGSADPDGVRRAGWTGVAMGAMAMSVSAAVMLWVPDGIVSLYIRDEAVRTIAVGLLTMAAMFQVADGIQVCALGALRGMKDTVVPMWMTFVSYWVVGLSLAYALGIHYRFGPRGLWSGLVISLAVAAVLLSLRFYRLSRRDI